MKIDEVIVHCLLRISNGINVIVNNTQYVRQNRTIMEDMVRELRYLNKKMDYVIEHSQSVDSDNES